MEPAVGAQVAPARAGTATTPAAGEVAVSHAQGWREPVIGVIGGLGPAATASFLQVVVDRTQAASDQEHLDLVVLQHSSTPDRTARILDDRAPDPTPVLAADARRLEALGVSAVVLPCNTAHHFMHAVEIEVGVPVVSIVDATAAAGVERARTLAGGDQAPVRVGVLATDGTRAAGVYQQALEALGAQAVLPDDRTQAEVMRFIYEGVKAGRPVDAADLARFAEHLIAAGAASVLLACTELSVVYAAERAALAAHPVGARLVDSLDSLAVATVRAAGRPVRELA